jgi:hypothetical protein
MTMKRYVSVAVAIAVFVGAAAVLALAGDDAPTAPPWVRADGTIDVSKAPDEFGVSGPDGEEVVCSNGRRLKVRKELLLGPPPGRPDQLRAERPASGGGDLVWRCGPGRNPHLNPVLVPRAQDPLRDGER